jgi:signal transduction histidine kinase
VKRTETNAETALHRGGGHALLLEAATLVAEGAAPESVFATLAPGLAELLAADALALVRVAAGAPPTVLAAHPADSAFDPAAQVPIRVRGRCWGFVAVRWAAGGSGQSAASLQRLEEFCELMVTAVANAESREQLRRIAEEQAALQRIATLTARAHDPEEVFAVVATEAGRVLDAETTRLMRIDDLAQEALVVASYGPLDPGMEVGALVSLSGQTLTRMMIDAGTVVRVDTTALEPGQLRTRLEQRGVRTAVIAPIVVDGRIWGSLGASWRRETTIDGIEEHVAGFASAVATALREASDREAIRELAAAQAALRRVATLVAGGAAPAEVLRAIAVEVNELMGVDATILARFDPPGTTATVMALASSLPSWAREGDVVPLEGDSTLTRVHDSGRPARIDDYRTVSGRIAERQRGAGRVASAGAPVTVEGRLWGAVIATWTAARAMPVAAEERLAEFTELIAVAIANSESSAELAASRVRVMLAGDEARRQIQRDLHDGAQQRLVSLALQLREAQRRARALVAGDPSVEARFEQLVQAVTDAGEELQRTARDLYPAGLERGGLQRALRGLARRAAIPLTLAIELPLRLPEPLEVVSYQIVQEAIHDAIKHGQASALTVKLTYANDSLELALTDDGACDGEPVPGTGLLALRDRVEALGGRLETGSAHGQGTEIVMRVTSVSRLQRLLT